MLVIIRSCNSGDEHEGTYYKFTDMEALEEHLKEAYSNADWQEDDEEYEELNFTIQKVKDMIASCAGGKKDMETYEIDLNWEQLEIVVV